MYETRTKKNAPHLNYHRNHFHNFANNNNFLSLETGRCVIYHHLNTIRRGTSNTKKSASVSMYLYGSIKCNVHTFQTMNINMKNWIFVRKGKKRISFALAVGIRRTKVSLMSWQISEHKLTMRLKREKKQRRRKTR